MIPVVRKIISSFPVAILIAFAGLQPGFAELPQPAHSDVRWDAENVDALIAFAEGSDAEGLDPENYSTLALKAAADAGDTLSTELAATALFESLAHDLGVGAISPRQRGRWFMSAPALQPASVAVTMEEALPAHRVAEQLQTFAPTDPQYLALRTALHASEDDGDRKILKLNMERWRWMPRNLGASYVFVNIPAYEVTLVRDGAEIARKRVIVGARKTPTPQFSALITGVVFNPTWFVPPSIVAESVGALLKRDPKKAAGLGYYVGDDGGVRQKPGPGNALGQVKLAMANPYSIYLHDTPGKKSFDLEKRALSHGCIRVDDALGFAREVLGPDWSDETIADLVSKNATVTVDLESPLPVYIGYFTAAAGAEGAVSYYPDIYGLDKKLSAVARAEQDELTDDPLGNCATTGAGQL